MKEDSIKRLMKASKLETSKEFTNLVAEKLDQHLQRRMKFRLYGLIFGVFILFSAMTFSLIASGFSLYAFGIILPLPRIATMVFISMTAYMLVLHLMTLLRLGEGRRLSVSG